MTRDSDCPHGVDIYLHRCGFCDVLDALHEVLLELRKLYAQPAQPVAQDAHVS